VRTRVFVLACLASTGAFAQTPPRFDISRMGCAEIQRLLGRGTAILAWRAPGDPGLPLFGLYIGDARACRGTQVAVPASVPAADTASCRVARCVQRSNPNSR
jgi:hypothetical protein